MKIQTIFAKSPNFRHESLTPQSTYEVDFKGLMGNKIIFKTLDAR